jgi:AcrR family transcriptional regulator
MRERVIATAVEMLARDGVAGFTTRRVAQQANTSAPAVYELFGDKAGLVAEVFFEGFRALGRRLNELTPSEDPRADLIGVIRSFRQFVRDNPVLADLMFSRPFADFDPGPAERRAGDVVRQFIVRTVRRCVTAGVMAGTKPTSRMIVAAGAGLAGGDRAARQHQASMDRRWDLATPQCWTACDRPADRKGRSTDAQLSAPHRGLEWRDVASPELGDGTAALFRLVAVARSEIDPILVGAGPTSPDGFAVGHEAVAEVVQTGPGTSTVTVGQLVFCSFQICCGRCLPCRGGRTANCAEYPVLSDYGMQPLSGVEYGGMVSDLVRSRTRTRC